MFNEREPMLEWWKVQYYHRYTTRALDEIDRCNIAFLATMHLMGARADKRHWLCVHSTVHPTCGGTNVVQARFPTIYGTFGEFGVEPHGAQKRLLLAAEEGTHALAEWRGDDPGTILFSPVPFDKFGRPKIDPKVLSVAKAVVFGPSGVAWDGSALVSAVRAEDDYPAESLGLMTDLVASAWMREMVRLKLVLADHRHWVKSNITPEDFTNVFGVDLKQTAS